MTKNTELPKFNIELHNAIIAEIEADPTCWDQGTWHCGTAHCYGGWAQIKAGFPQNEKTVQADARVALGLTRVEASYAFSGSNSLETLKSIPAWIERNRAGRDRAGRDRDGYDRVGYDRDGYDRDGYDRAGLDQFNNRRDLNGDGK